MGREEDAIMEPRETYPVKINVIAKTSRQIMYDAGKINFAMIDDDVTFFYRDRNYKKLSY